MPDGPALGTALLDLIRTGRPFTLVAVMLSPRGSRARVDAALRCAFAADADLRAFHLEGPLLAVLFTEDGAARLACDWPRWLRPQLLILRGQCPGARSAALTAVT